MAIVAIVVLTFEGEASAEFGDPVITGDALPFLPEGGNDPALGTIAPEVTGADFAENEVSIAHGDTAKVILFLAHWCPHCQREVPIVQDWLESAPLPDSVELISVSTSISSTRAFCGLRLSAPIIPLADNASMVGTRPLPARDDCTTITPSPAAFSFTWSR